MRAGIPARMAARNGGRSRAARVLQALRTTGSTWWESLLVAPWPGKCFPTGRTPPDSEPRRKATPRRPASPGSAESARSPITGFRALLSTSSTGAKLMSTSTARSSVAIAAAAASAALSARQHSAA